MQRIKKAYAENGDLKIIPEIPPLDGSENWEQGRGAYYELDNDPNTGDPLALDIDREQDNYIKNVITKNIKHWQENTYPIYFDDIEYPKNAIVKYTDGNYYVSKVDNNTALPTDTNNWTIYDPSSLDGQFVNLTGNQTIAGVKTFSSSPIVPTPTTDFQVATKEYVDDNSFNPTPTITGAVSFNSTTNNIQLTNIVTALGLEIGDVIQISGSTDNNSEFTVEVITDPNNIIVNQAHAGKSLTYLNGKRTKTLNSETSNVTIKLLAKWYNAPIGLGQGWVNVKTSRTSDINYPNNTNRILKINIIGSYISDSSDFSLLENSEILSWIIMADVPAGYKRTLTGEINRNCSYRLNAPNISISDFLELR